MTENRIEASKRFADKIDVEMTDNFNRDKESMLPHVISELIAKDGEQYVFYHLERVADTAIARRVSQAMPNLLDLYNYLSGLTNEDLNSEKNPFSSSASQKFIILCNDVRRKSIAFSTQTQCFILSLVEEKTWVNDQRSVNWVPHLRKTSHWDDDNVPVEQEYFTYYDKRDKGYLCSLKSDPLVEGNYTTEGSLICFHDLDYVLAHLLSTQKIINDMRTIPNKTSKNKP